jgi:aminocarboxymuconate-semialdehyde decarboxylase
VTVDIHSHVAVPEAAKFVAPHLDLATIPLAHFANAGTKALTQKQEADISARRGSRSAARRSRRHGHRHADRRAAAAAMLLHGAARHRGQGRADRQRRHRRVLRARGPTGFKGFGTVPMPDGREAANELERCVKTLGFTGVEVLTNVAGKELSDPAFAPFWQKAEELGACW